MIISVINQKGGVGKTTTTVNLGAALAQMGHDVLLLDLDTTQQSLVRQTSNLDAHFANCAIETCSAKALATTLKRQKTPALNDQAGKVRVGNDRAGNGRAGNDDQSGINRVFILLDCPPTLGHETAAALTASDLAVVPLQPELPALEGLASLHATLEAARTQNPSLALRLLLTMSDARDPNCAVIEAQVRELFGSEVLSATVKRSPVFGRAVLEGTSVLQTSPHSHGAIAYRQAATEIIAWGTANHVR